MITVAQAEVISDLYSAHWDTFHPSEAFPARTNAHNAKRRTCRTLERKGLVKRVYIQPYDDRPHMIEAGRHYRLKLTDKAYDAFTEYAKSVEYDFPF
jgi:hypothetical protein